MSRVSPSRTGIPSWRHPLLLLLGGMLLASSTLQTWLSQPDVLTSFLSPPTIQQLLPAVATWQPETPDQPAGWQVLWGMALLVSVVGTMGLIFIGGGLLTWTVAPEHRGSLFRRWCGAVGIVGLLLGLWDWLGLPVILLGRASGALVWMAIVPFWVSTLLALLVTLGFTQRRAVMMSGKAGTNTGPIPAAGSSSLTTALGIAAAVYTVVFVLMNWGLWFNLRLPHGDSAMYEEHLWNLLHGKGFRSYLDQGLFLGEHVQVIHLALLPLYLLWPSHLLLELCESAALAAGVFPVAWMARRHTGSRGVAIAAAVAYLAYTPMQFLDIEIDLKTFRPEAFGIPLLLVALDQLDRRRLGTFFLALVPVLAVKEDATLVLGPLGLWIAGAGMVSLRQSTEGSSRQVGWRWIVAGLALTVLSVLYLWLATRVVMPYFREGGEIHYTSYFARLGDSPEAIVRTVLTRPAFVIGELATVTTLLYVCALLAPLGWIPLVGAERLLVGLPWLGVLCLNELARDPRHQFHAFLVPVVFWALAPGLARLPAVVPSLSQRWKRAAPSRETTLATAACWMVASSFATGLLFSLGPLGLSFWDPGSNWSVGRLYWPGPRGPAFAAVGTAIPQTARVASTDYVHPRFTHHERSYDYSQFRRRVSDYEQKVPVDTDYIVIDLDHPYSTYRTVAEIPEARVTDTWEVLPDLGGGLFAVLKRRATTTR